MQRQDLAQELFEKIVLSATTPAKHYALLIGMRGMGKTHLVALIYYRLLAEFDRHPTLKDKLAIAWLREEEWGVDSWLDLVSRILRALAVAEPQSKSLLEELRRISIEDSIDRAAANATRLLKEAIGNRTLLLIMENLDDLFKGLGEAGQQQFRSFLQAEQCCTILATTPALFTAVQSRSKPFFGFFNPIYLDRLTVPEAIEMLGKIATLGGQEDLASFLQTPLGRARVRAVHHLAGGNPRVYMLFSQFITLLAENESDVHAWSMRGISLRRLGRYEEAIANYDRAIELKLDRHEAWHERGISMCEVGRYKEAIASFDRTIELKPDNYEAWYNRGVCLDNLERYKEAISSYEGALEYKPDLKEAWHNRGISLGKLARYEEAIASFDRAIEIQPDRDDVWYNRGIAQGNIGNYKDAIVSFDRAIEIQPSKYKAWYDRGVSLGLLGRYEEAIDSYTHFISIKPDEPEAWYGKGIAQGNLGKYKEAIDSFERTIELKSNHCGAWHDRGLCFHYLGDYERAIFSYDRALSIEVNDYKSWSDRGISLTDLGRYKEAIESFNRAISIEPDEYIPIHNQGWVYFKSGKFTESLNCFERAIAIAPNSHVSWYRKGLVQFVMGNYEAALNSWQQSFQIIQRLTPRPNNIAGLIQEFLEELTPRFSLPNSQPQISTFLTQLTTVYQQAQVLPELSTALIATLPQILAPNISDRTADEWLALWQNLLGTEPALEMPLRLMNVAIAYKKQPAQQKRLWLGLAKEERSILNGVLGLGVE